MRVLSKLHAEKGIWQEDKPVPEICQDEVLIKISKTAICGTDVHIYNWDHWSQKNVPIGTTLGHEYVGVVEAIGSTVTNVEVGDRVTSEGHIVCHQCRYCLDKVYHLCPHTLGTGIHRDGAFAEYVAVPAFNVIRIPEFVSDETAAILDPFGNAVNSIYKAIKEGSERVLITGAGPIGIMAALTLQKMNIHVTVYDIREHRVKLARQMGVKHVLNPESTLFSDQLNYDCGIEMAGSYEALEVLLERVDNGSNVAVLGVAPTKRNLCLHNLIFKEISLKGVYGREMYQTWTQMFALLSEGLNIEQVITHEYHVDDFDEAFRMAASGDAGKVLIDWSE
ncbi:L-threonine 3-dehydrogenase [Neptuniibacter sp. QD37_11]|uniref:L-threonine 3-dehydrogenase n=1 Tax=Neptuniibacter sp. QD37_11 TaxID=3398209 RepID=UPI0039F52F6A